MNTKLRKLAKLAAAGLFLVALVINVKVTLDEPFRLVSDRALAQAGGTTGELESCWVRTEVSCRMKIGSFEWDQDGLICDYNGKTNVNPNEECTHMNTLWCSVTKYTCKDKMPPSSGGGTW